MNSWLLIRRLRGPAFLILVGITALLNQWGVLSFSRSWPLYLILAGRDWAGRASRHHRGSSRSLPPTPGPMRPLRTHRERRCRLIPTFRPQA